MSSYNPLAPQLGALTPGLSPGSLQDAGVKGYGSSSLMPALPKPEPPKPETKPEPPKPIVIERPPPPQPER